MQVALWSTISIVFVVAVLVLAAFSMYRMFGGGQHTPQH